MKFYGHTYEPRRDAHRLQTQQDRVREFLLNTTARGQWVTVPEIAAAIGAKNQESVGRQVRYLRRPEFGSYRVERRTGAEGLPEFQVREPETVLQLELESA